MRILVRLVLLMALLGLAFLYSRLTATQDGFADQIGLVLLYIPLALATWFILLIAEAIYARHREGRLGRGPVLFGLAGLILVLLYMAVFILGV